MIVARIDGIKEHFRTFTIEKEHDRKEPTYNEIRSHFQNYLGKSVPEQKPIELFPFIESFIQNATTKPNPITKKLVAKCTLQGYKRVKEILKQYNDEVQRINFDLINYEFYTDFNVWAESKNYSRNYIGKLTKTLKTFLNEAIEQSVTTNTAFQSKRFSVIKEETDNIYLNTDELNSIWKLDLSNDAKLEKARDLFLIGAFTGLRVSDFSQLDTHNFKTVNGIELIHVKTKKTGKTVSIPLHPIVKGILSHNPNVTTSSMSNPEINKHLKTIGQLAKIDELEYTTRTMGGKQVTQKHKKYDLITSHTARRSFCTNAYLSGMPPIDIMTVSGHKTEKAFLIYIKATTEEKAIKLAKHEFFNPKSTLKVV